MRWAVAVGVLAGCFNPAVEPGAPCADNGACPGALVCMNGTCERDGAAQDAPIADDAAPIDAAPIDAIEPDGPPSDLDGDSVPNASDNCPTASNTDQHDEDADTVGDSCDNCPHLANTNQASALDADTVGDACDPNPLVAGDSIAKFIAFHTWPIAGVTTTGAWTHDVDQLVHPTTNDASLKIAGTWTRTIFEIGGQQMASNPPFSWVAVTVGESSNYYHCGFEDEINGGETDFHRGVYGEGQGSNWQFDDAIDHFNPARLAGAFTIRMTGDADGNTIRCAVSDSRGSVTTNDEGAPGLSPGAVGVRSEGITFAVRYAIVFTR